MQAGPKMGPAWGKNLAKPDFCVQLFGAKGAKKGGKNRPVGRFLGNAKSLPRFSVASFRKFFFEKFSGEIFLRKISENFSSKNFDFS